MASSVDAVIIGMGYVGLAREATAAGPSVIGLDVNPEVVDGLNHGRSNIDDVDSVAEHLQPGTLVILESETRGVARLAHNVQVL